MDTMQSGLTRRQAEERPHRFTRPLLTAALACFALPFLTVTCYGDDVTVSGIQAATTIDLTPQETPDPGDRQFAQEGEPPNLFVLVALLATVGGLAVSFGSAALRRVVTGAAALAAIVLVAFIFYAVHRSTGNVMPDIGLTAAIVSLVGAAWAAVGAVPRWVIRTIAGTAVGMVPYSLLGTEAQVDFAIGFLAFYGATILAVGLAVGAIRSSVDPAPVRTGESPGAVRIAGAALVAAVGVVVGGVVAPYLMAALVSGELDPSFGDAYVFATLTIGSVVAVSTLAWDAGRRIVRPRRRAALAVGLPVAQG